VLFATKALSSSAITEAELNILYISQYFPPEMGAPAARVSELSRHWARQGHDVTVLTGFPNHPDGVVRPEYRRQFRRLKCREIDGSVNVVRTWLLPFPNRKPYERVLNYISFFASAAMTGTFLERPDVVIASSPQLLVGLAGWWIARLKRVPFVFEVRDLWPESLAAVGIGKSDSMLYRLLRRIAGFLYSKADHIVVVTPAFRDHLIDKWNVPSGKLSVVSNGVETGVFSPRNNATELREEFQVQGKFVVSFIGTFGLAHGLETVIVAAEQLQSIAPDILFLLVGEGADRERIASIATEKHLANVRFVAQQPREKVPEFIAVSDVCLVLLKKSEVFKTVIPTKMLEFMSCARPVILGVEGQAGQILENSRAGICIPPQEPAALCEAIIRLRADASMRSTLGRNGREYILRNFSRERTAVDYMKALSEVLSGPAITQAVAA
jgi:glycosyltransferase involved in cell wall biosynthesis